MTEQKYFIISYNREWKPYQWETAATAERVVELTEAMNAPHVKVYTFDQPFNRIVGIFNYNKWYTTTGDDLNRIVNRNKWYTNI